MRGLILAAGRGRAMGEIDSEPDLGLYFREFPDK